MAEPGGAASAAVSTSRGTQLVCLKRNANANSTEYSTHDVRSIIRRAYYPLTHYGMTLVPTGAGRSLIIIRLFGLQRSRSICVQITTILRIRMALCVFCIPDRGSHTPRYTRRVEGFNIRCMKLGTKSCHISIDKRCRHIPDYRRRVGGTAVFPFSGFLLLVPSSERE